MRLTVFLTIISFSSHGQWIGSDQIDTSKVYPWVPKIIIEYQGVYHFGTSEDESDLLLISTMNGEIAQIRSGFWSSDGKQWVYKFVNIENSKIKGNKITAENLAGEFVIYNNDTDRLKGLKIYSPWSRIPGSRQWEIGLKTGSIETYFSGNYKSASMRLLSEEELNPMKRSELRIMRNEIFARYGLKFMPGGDMDTYFRKQSWYRPYYDSVEAFITTIEKRNIDLILRIEGR